jgi:hypothetical protein
MLHLDKSFFGSFLKIEKFKFLIFRHYFALIEKQSQIKEAVGIILRGTPIKII